MRGPPWIGGRARRSGGRLIVREPKAAARAFRAAAGSARQDMEGEAMRWLFKRWRERGDLLRMVETLTRENEMLRERVAVLTTLSRALRDCNATLDRQIHQREGNR